MNFIFSSSFQNCTDIYKIYDEKEVEMQTGSFEEKVNLENSIEKKRQKR